MDESEKAELLRRKALLFKFLSFHNEYNMRVFIQWLCN